MTKKIIFYQIKTLCLISSVFLNSCTSSPDNTVTKQVSQDLQASPTIQKIDTVFKDFKSCDRFTDEIIFGMPLKKWNAFVARKTKEGYYDELFETGLNSYNAHATISGIGKVAFWLKPEFLGNSITDENTVQLLRIGKLIQSEPVLKELNYEFEIYLPDDGNDLVNSFIRDHNMTFVAGSDPLKLDNEIATIDNFWFNNELQKSAKEKIANTTKVESTGFSSESLFENKVCYAVLKIEKTMRYELLRNSESDIYSIGKGDNSFSIRINVVSKFYSQLDIEKYRTQQEKDLRKSKNTTDELINKALNN